MAGMKDSLTSFLHKYSYHQVTYLLTLKGGILPAPKFCKKEMCILVRLCGQGMTKNVCNFKSNYVHT